MTDSVPSDLKLQPPTRTIKADDYRDVYCNSTKTSVTQWDIRATVGMTVDLDGSPALKEMATIIMSPQHAKAVLRTLAETIQKYEAVFGPIPDPVAARESRQRDAEDSNAEPDGKKR